MEKETQTVKSMEKETQHHWKKWVWKYPSDIGSVIKATVNKSFQLRR